MQTPACQLAHNSIVNMQMFSRYNIYVVYHLSWVCQHWKVTQVFSLKPKYWTSYKFNSMMALEKSVTHNFKGPGSFMVSRCLIQQHIWHFLEIIPKLPPSNSLKLTPALFNSNIHVFFQQAETIWKLLKMAWSAEVELKQVSKKYVLSCQLCSGCCWVFFNTFLSNYCVIGGNFKEIQNVTTYLSWNLQASVAKKCVHRSDYKSSWEGNINVSVPNIMAIQPILVEII